MQLFKRIRIMMLVAVCKECKSANQFGTEIVKEGHYQ